jgi:hypothetical protein
MMSTETLRGPDYRPAGVFISYSTEDYDIAQALYQSLQDLGETVYDRVKVFLDSKSMAGGDGIREEIRAALMKSDFLVVLYTGVIKQSHYTGYEVGFFDALIQAEKKKNGQSGRKIVSLYLDQPPNITEDTLGIKIKIESQDLGGSRGDYLRRSSQSPDDRGELGKFLHQIADKAESRLPSQLTEDREAITKNQARRKTKVTDEIIPTLKGKLFDCLGTRIMRRSVEQKLFEFDFPSSTATYEADSIPDDTKVFQHSSSFDIFGVSGGGGEFLTWKDFKNQIESREGASSIVLAMEDVLLSAISPTRVLENDQIVRSPVNDNIYRILVTRQMDFFNGRKIVHVYFVQTLKGRGLGDPDTSIVLAFINVAAKYRFIFIERESPLSVESFSISKDQADLKKLVRQLIHELLLIEEEARGNGLDKPAAIYKYFGSDQDRLEQVRNLQTQWFENRQKLMLSAEKVISIPTDSPEFSSARDEWLGKLQEFRDASEAINSIVTTQALENLKGSFVLKEHG